MNKDIKFFKEYLNIRIPLKQERKNLISTKAGLNPTEVNKSNHYKNHLIY